MLSLLLRSISFRKGTTRLASASLASSRRQAAIVSRRSSWVFSCSVCSCHTREGIRPLLTMPWAPAGKKLALRVGFHAPHPCWVSCRGRQGESCRLLQEAGQDNFQMPPLPGRGTGQLQEAVGNKWGWMGNHQRTQEGASLW